MSEKMSVAKAIETLQEIAKAKQEGTTRPDAALAPAAAAAVEVVNKAAAEAARTEPAIVVEPKRPVFKGGPALDGGSRARMAYQTLIHKRAGSGDDWLRSFQRWNDDVLIAAVATGREPADVIKRHPEFSEFIEDELGKQSSELAKAIAAATAGAGLEWIPEIWSSELIDLIRTERVLVNAFRRFMMANGTMRLPQFTQEFSGFVVTESTGNTPYAIPAIVSNPGTANVILTAVELAVASIWSKTFEEDSIIPAIPEIRRRIIEGMAKAIEDALINGSTDSPHPDSDVSASQPATAWNGLRADAMGSDFADQSGTVDLSGANMTADNVLKLKLLQGRFGAKDSDNLWVTSPQGLVKLMGLRDASGLQILMTLDKFGPSAVLMQGSVARLFGADVIVSDLVKTTLNPAGVVPATPTIDNQTQILRVHKGAFTLGDRRSLTVESDTAPLTRQRIMVATERLIFARTKPAQDADKDRAVTIGRNVDTV